MTMITQCKRLLQVVCEWLKARECVLPLCIAEFGKTDPCCPPLIAKPEHELGKARSFDYIIKRPIELLETPRSSIVCRDRHRCDLPYDSMPRERCSA